ncbi:MAG: polyphenol oxidase family protein [Tannerellaceae bacterium]|nr:polyphenol oxidase family protein [Tannerellaceae bacterium]
MRTTSLEDYPRGWLRFPSLAARPEITHFACTLQEAPALQEALKARRLHLSRQIHSNRIAIVDSRTGELHGFDALVSAEAGICVGVSTADCVPVLLYAPDRRVVAAVHAGWRSTVGQIARATAALMADTFGCEPALMLAGIAPAIGCEAFEVGPEVPEAFLSAGIDISSFHFRNPTSGKSHIDLKRANYNQLLSAGLAACNIAVADACTFGDAATFSSARRQGTDCRRMLSGIMLRAEGRP